MKLPELWLLAYLPLSWDRASASPIVDYSGLPVNVTFNDFGGIGGSSFSTPPRFYWTPFRYCWAFRPPERPIFTFSSSTLEWVTQRKR